MAAQDAGVGPVQLVLIGFETTERFRGETVRELAALRGHGVIRVLDARLLLRGGDGRLTEVDLGPLLGSPPMGDVNPVAHLFGLNGHASNGAREPGEALSDTVGFALDDLRRLADEIGPGEHVAALLIEHLWAAGVREAVLGAGGRLVG